MTKKLIRNKDYDGWAWYYDNDPDHGTGLDTSEMFEARVQFAHAYRRRGKFVRVKLVPVDPLPKPIRGSR